MALTITLEGKGVIANADLLTNDTGGTGTGDWGEDGGGAIYLNPDVYLYGSASIGMKYASKSGYTYFDIGSTNELDFDVAGAEEGQFVYMWLNIQSKGQFDTLANKGFAIRLGTDLSNYREWIIAGEDDANGWAGGWKLFVVDPTLDGSVSDTGSYDPGSVRYFGIWLDTNVSVRAESVFISQMAVCKGLRVNGTSTTPWQDVIDYCTDYANRAWGVVQEREGVAYVYGKIWFGASSQAANASFVETASPVVKFGITEFYDGSNWVLSHPPDYAGVIVEDAEGYTTTFTDGVIVGTDSGRSGATFLGTEDIGASFDVSGENLASSVKLYSTGFQEFSGEIAFKPDADHDMMGCSFSVCGPVYGQSLEKRNVTVAQANKVGMVLNDPDFDLEDSIFISNPIGVDIGYSGEMTFDNVKFSGNVIDVRSIAQGSPVFTEETVGSTSTSTNLYDRYGVSFPGPTVPQKLTSCAHWCRVSGNPGSPVWSELYVLSGEWDGNGRVEAGSSPVAVSETRTEAEIPFGAYDWMEFVYLDEYTLVSGENYAIVFASDNDDVSNNVRFELTDTDPSSKTIYRNKSSGTWSGDGGDALPIRVGQGEIVHIFATEGSNPTTDAWSGEYPIGVFIETVVQFKLTGLPQNTQVTWVEEDSHPPVQLYEIENVGGDGEATWSYDWTVTGDMNCDIHCHHLNYKYRVIEGVELSATNQTIPVTLEEDPVYKNP